MFSTKIIIAVEVLLALDRSTADAPVCKGKGTDLSGYLSVYRMQKSLFRNVLRRLSDGKVIERTAVNKYVLLEDTANITILRLVQLLHGDLCLGEPYAHSLTYGRENYNSEACKNFRSCEQQIYHMLRSKLAALPISHFEESSLM